MPVRGLVVLGIAVVAIYIYYDVYKTTKKAYNAFLWALFTFIFPYFTPIIYLIYKKIPKGVFQSQINQQNGTSSLCPKCGTDVSPSDATCPSCGNQLSL